MMSPEQREEHEMELDQLEGERIHAAIAHTDRENANLLKAVERQEKQITNLTAHKNAMENQVFSLLEQIAALVEALGGLLDGLDANYDERCGLTQKQWDRRIKDARQALAGGE